MTDAVARRSGAAGGTLVALDDHGLRRFEQQYPDGITVSQIIEIFTNSGIRLSEATFRKWVQIGLLPRSRRVGRKGKHQGSRGLYPTGTLRRINQIKRLMAEDMTIEEISSSLQFRDDIDAIARGIDELLERFAQAPETAGDSARAKTRARLMTEVRKYADELIDRLETLERHVVTPLERAAKQRAFGAGNTGGADELL